MVQNHRRAEMDNIKNAEDLTQAVTELLKSRNSNEADKKLRAIERAQKIKDAENDSVEAAMKALNDNPEVDFDKNIKQDFGCIKRIYAYKGVICIDADTTKAHKRARDMAFIKFGVPRNTAEMKKMDKFVKSNTITSVRISPAKFLESLKAVAKMILIQPEFFGAESGGAVVTDIFRDGIAALRAADKYYKRNLSKAVKIKDKSNKKVEETMYKLTVGSTLPADKELVFQLLMEDWELYADQEHYYKAKHILFPEL